MEENLLDDKYDSGTIVIEAAIKEHLRVAAKWAKFLAIVTFIFAALIVIAAISMIGFGSSFGNELDYLPGGMGLIGFIYLVFAGIYLIPAISKYKFSNNVKAAIASNNQQQMIESMRNLRSIFSFYGILSAIFIGFYALIFLIAILGLGSKLLPF